MNRTIGFSNASGTGGSATWPSRGDIVAVAVDTKTFILGTVNEKIAGGLFEVILKIDGTEFSAVLRRDEILASCTAVGCGGAAAEIGYGAAEISNEGGTQ